MYCIKKKNEKKKCISYSDIRQSMHRYVVHSIEKAKIAPNKHYMHPDKCNNGFPRVWYDSE